MLRVPRPVRGRTARPTLYPQLPPTACRLVTVIPLQMRRPRLGQASDIITTKSLSAAKWPSMSPSSAISGRAPCPLNGWGPTHGRRERARPLQASVPLLQSGPRAEHQPPLPEDKTRSPPRHRASVGTERPGEEALLSPGTSWLGSLGQGRWSRTETTVSSDGNWEGRPEDQDTFTGL